MTNVPLSDLMLVNIVSELATIKAYRNRIATLQDHTVKALENMNNHIDVLSNYLDMISGQDD